MPELKQIYQTEAEQYQALVGREDYENHLLPAILSIDPLEGKTVIELGAGTGRVSCLIVPCCRTLIAADVSHHMLALGKQYLTRSKHKNWCLSLESHWALPFRNQSADVVIAGWSFCYAALDAGKAWQTALENGLNEVWRILRPDGKLILIESLGTGYETPNAPEVLVEYLDYLNTHGFTSKWIRTDYCFADLKEAQSLTTFFFGEDPLPMWETPQGMIVPECTGLWWKEKPRTHA